MNIRNTEATSRIIILELVSYDFERNEKTDLVKLLRRLLETRALARAMTSRRCQGGKNYGRGKKIPHPVLQRRANCLDHTSRNHIPEPPDIQHTLETQMLPPPRCSPRGHNTYAFTHPCSMSHPVFITTAGQLAIPA